MKYKCDKCLKEFHQKSNFDYHISRKRPCIKEDNIINDVNITNKNELSKVIIDIIQNYEKLSKKEDNITINEINETIFNCLLCEKSFKYKSGLSKHKIKHGNYKEEVRKLKDKNIEKDNKIKQLLEENEINTELIKTLESKLKDKNITNNTNSNNTVNNTINIIQFGKEDLEKLTKEEINKIIYTATGVDPLLTSIEVVHFNKRLPEQQNIKCNNINSKYVDIFNGTTWNKESMNSVIDDLADSHSYNLSELSKTADEKKLKSVVAKSCKVVDDSNKLYNNDLEYSDEDKVKVDKKNKKVRKAYAEKKEDIKKFIYNKTKEQITI